MMMAHKKVFIRAEQPNDADNVYRLHYGAFGGREDESRLVERIRASEGYIPELSLIAAEEDGRAVGHALFSKAELADCVYAFTGFCFCCFSGVRRRKEKRR
jgi:predicted N-acetyltransferase YhbS